MSSTMHDKGGKSDAVTGTAELARNCAVIAHRGASAYLPEHTSAAYRLAIGQGADFIEADVILSKDGVPVVRHENLLSLTTDIDARAAFAARQRMQTLGDEQVDDWFSEDFTAAEIASIRAVERYPELRPQSARFDSQYPVLTLQQVIDLWRQARDAGSHVGLYIELKEVAYFKERGLDSVEIILDTLNENGLNGSNDAVLLQSFDAPSLQRAAELTDLPLVQLLRSAPPGEIEAAISPAAMARIAGYADGIGVPKGLVYTRSQKDSADTSSNDMSFEQTPLVQSAHAAGLFVHVFTFRAENEYLMPPFNSADQSTGDLAGQIRMFLDAGIDGFFTDNPDIGRATCDAWRTDADI